MLFSKRSANTPQGGHVPAPLSRLFATLNRAVTQGRPYGRDITFWTQIRIAPDASHICVFASRNAGRARRAAYDRDFAFWTQIRMAPAVSRICVCGTRKLWRRVAQPPHLASIFIRKQHDHMHNTPKTFQFVTLFWTITEKYDSCTFKASFLPHGVNLCRIEIIMICATIPLRHNIRFYAYNK